MGMMRKGGGGSKGTASGFRGLRLRGEHNWKGCMRSRAEDIISRQKRREFSPG